MTEPDMLYVEASDYLAKSNSQALASALGPDEAEDLILDAMTQIDAYIGLGWDGHDPDQEFTFPRDRDTDAGDAPFIPRAISMATVLVADSLLQRRNATSGILPHMVKSETNLGHSYTLSDRYTEKGFEHWPPEVFNLLWNFRPGGGQFAVV